MASGWGGALVAGLLMVGLLITSLTLGGVMLSRPVSTSTSTSLLSSPPLPPPPAPPISPSDITSYTTSPSSLAPTPDAPFPPLPAGVICTLTPDMMSNQNGTCILQDADWCQEYVNHMSPCVFDSCAHWLYSYSGIEPARWRLWLGLGVNTSAPNVNYYTTLWTIPNTSVSTSASAQLVARIMNNNTFDPVPKAPSLAQRFDWPDVESYAINASVLAREIIATQMTFVISPDGFSMSDLLFTLSRCPSNPLSAYPWLGVPPFTTIGDVYSFVLWLSGLNVEPGATYTDLEYACGVQDFETQCEALFGIDGYYIVDTLWDPSATPSVREDFYNILKTINEMFVSCGGSDCIGVDP